MRYLDYPDHTKTFVVVKYTGCGVMESPYQRVGVVAEEDTLEEALKEADRITRCCHTPAELLSSWCPFTFEVHVNTCTEKGKELLEEFKKKFDETLERISNDPNHVVYEINGHIIHLIKNDLFDKKESIL